MDEKERPSGRPSKYKPEYCEKILYFFTREYTREVTKIRETKNGAVEVTEEKPNPLPLFEKFAVEIGVHRETLLNWTTRHPEFFDAYKKAKEIQLDMLLQNGLAGHYNSAFGIFALKNMFGWRDKQEIEQSGTVSINIDKDDEAV